MGTAQAILAIVLGAIALIGVVSGVAAFFRKGLGDAAVKRYEQVHDADVARIQQLEHDVSSLQTEVSSLKRENSTLRDLATGQSAILALTEIVAANQTALLEAVAGLGTAIETECSQIKGLMGDERYPKRPPTRRNR